MDLKQHKGTAIMCFFLFYKSIFFIKSKNALRGLLLSAGQQYKKPVQWLRRYYVAGNSGLGDTIFSKMVRASWAGVREFPFTSGLNELE